jgi:NAD(P)-dependent dehydrogenase (short-subunit alcohol dehydrogenase family)
VLDGRVAIVTGASRGIGEAIARRLAAEGAAVAVVARSLDAHPHLPGTLRETVRAIERAGGRALAVAADLADAAARARAVEETREALGPVDILVNNGAAAFYIPFEKVSERRFQVAFEVNVRAPWDLAQRVLADMRARGRGWIVNVSSAGARHPQGPPYTDYDRAAGATLYAASKAALDRVSSGLAAELHADRIAINSLAPVAAVLTPGVEALGVVPEAYRATAERVEVMAEAALALCEPRDPLLTGRVLLSGPLLEELGRAVRSLDGLAPVASA